MAVYTHFDGMPGLWRAVRQEGFQRLSARLGSVERGRDPVQHLAALGVAYVENALENPDLYRVMFDAAFDVPEPDAAAATSEPLVVAARRAQDAGRFGQNATPDDIALRYWVSGHGLTSLAVTGVLAVADLQCMRRRWPLPCSRRRVTLRIAPGVQSRLHGGRGVAGM